MLSSALVSHLRARLAPHHESLEMAVILVLVVVSAIAIPASTASAPAAIALAMVVLLGSIAVLPSFLRSRPAPSESESAE